MEISILEKILFCVDYSSCIRRKSKVYFGIFLYLGKVSRSLLFALGTRHKMALWELCCQVILDQNGALEIFSNKKEDLCSCIKKVRGMMPLSYLVPSSIAVYVK